MNPSDNVGSIEWDSRINTSQLKRDAAEAEAIARSTGSSMGDSAERGESRASVAFGKLARAAKVAAIAGGVVLASGIAAAAKASFSQVDAVQQATVALNAYERDGNKVNAVLKNLVAFAQSDMGVLFNRKDLFKSAQSLRIMGDRTEDLTGHVKILSRSVGLGMSNWEDLNLIVGRVGSTGRLTGEDFDNLTKAGYRLNPALRNTNITFAELFKQLDKGIPADALNNQAQTIQGRLIRLQTAFRNVGDAILGVDSQTGKFISGGLGDRFVSGLTLAAFYLKNLATSFREIVPQIQAVAGRIADYLGPKLSALWNTIRNDVIPAVSGFVRAFGPTIGAGLVWAIGLTVDALNLFLTVITPVINYLNNNRWIVWAMVGAFAAFRAVLFIQSAVNAFVTGLAVVRGAILLTTGTAKGATGAMGALRLALLLLKGPWQVVLVIVGVATVLAGLKTIGDKLDDLFRKWNSQDKSKVRLGGSNIEVSGGSSLGLTQRLRNAFSGFRASGGPVMPGRSYVVGEDGPEMFVPKTSGDIIPESSTSSQSVSININMQGIMSRSKNDERDIAKSLVKRLNDELRAKNITPIGDGALA